MAEKARINHGWTRINTDGMNFLFPVGRRQRIFTEGNEGNKDRKTNRRKAERTERKSGQQQKAEKVCR
jgi:hypothetical protein